MAMLPGAVPAHAQDARATPVEAVTVEPEPLTVTIEAAAGLTANESVVISPEIDGRIAEIAFSEGDPVKKDDLLFRLKDDLLRAQWEEAKASLKLAEQNFERATALLQKRAGTERALDEAQAQLLINEARVAVARERLDETRIHAPFGGYVGFRSVSVGDYVSKGDELVEVVSVDPMKVTFDIPERYLRDVALGQTVTVTLDALPGESFTGKVTAMSPRVTAAGRSLRLRAEVANENARLKPGLFARVAVTLAERDTALLVPESAIVPRGSERFVYTVAEGKAHFVKVVPGVRRAGRVEIREGLEPGDVVVTAGQLKLRDGAPVTVLDKGES
ncbi:efflux RND transporter periplasmic adaptor subunit [Kaustia mangrovi]|uniref:Efflux RND transporter periplasmic adaptor subunit n=2 Tax=Kaustia mangrovi TaxID=2593653 RepID=A0A7S8HBW2_9HYPH|nr:efflux RND transporter periplasmic adaptor subunit [Kaustia mangrovi]